MILDNSRPVVVLVSALAEWPPVVNYYHPEVIENNRYGEFFLTKINNQPVIFQYGGWGKISAAASAEYSIQQWNPETVINLGTCG
ncbi:MAG TPA: hypothetical protein VF338_07280, partial [Leptolinea sp.]